MRRAFLLCGVVCSSLMMAMPAVAQFGGGGFGGGGFGPQAPPKPPEDPRPIQLEITILDAPAAEAAAKPLTDEQQLARLERLELENKLSGLQRLKLNLIANQQSQLQIGESVNVVVGRSRAPGDPTTRGGFGQMETTRVQEVGTLVQATARAVANGAVAEIKLERSGMVPARAAGPDAPVAEYPKRDQMTVSTTLLLKNGENTIIASSLTNQADKPREETWVLARVNIAPPEKVAEAAIKIFHLKNVAADDMANLISTLFSRGDVRAVPDVRTNTIIVASAPEDVLQQIEAILLRLDESPAAAAATPQVRKIVPIPEGAAPFFNPLTNPVDQSPPKRRPPARNPRDDLDNRNADQ